VQMELFIALLLVMPIVLFFVVFVWYLNIAGIHSALRESRLKRQAVAGNKKLETGKA